MSLPDERILRLLCDPDPAVRAQGREVLLSTGAALEHLRLFPAGWFLLDPENNTAGLCLRLRPSNTGIHADTLTEAFEKLLRVLELRPWMLCIEYQNTHVRRWRRYHYREQAEESQRYYRLQPAVAQAVVTPWWEVR
tara:strand:+ start:292 stop:702 length:411 start_codon:yes stop_codon:yes gene_type:complete